MKKILLITLMMCFVGSFAACGREVPEVKTESTQSTSEKETENIQTTGEKESESSQTTGETVEDNEQSPVVEKPQILSLQETRNVKYEGVGAHEKMLLISEFNHVTFWEGKDKYSEMNRTLSELADMITRSQKDEADSIVSFAQEMFDIDSGNYETQVSTLDVQVRRADSVVVSLLSDSYADYGFIEDFRGMWGSNYDTQTGKELLLSDVVLNMEPIPGIVLKELNSHIWAGEPYSEAVVENYFKNISIEAISWTLDYNGVTFYFGDGDINEPGNGCVSATVSFAEHPELFEKKYMNVPEAYIVRLPLDHSFFTDLDGDGTLEELNCTGFYSEAESSYTDFGIPYYVKTADGNHYLYVFCEKSEESNRQMTLTVYNVNAGILTRIGEMNIAPAYIPSDIFVLPLDPNNLFLDNFDSFAQDAEFYMVGSNGMLRRKFAEGTQPEVAEVDNVKDFLEAIKPGATIVIKPGYYNLSEYTEEIWNKEGEKWNQNHPYVNLRECFDGGIEVVVRNVDEISITGDVESPNVTELVVETRYGAVLNFEGCNNVFINGLTMGHTQISACYESVITFSNSRGIYLSALDLYGCGVYGFTAKNGSGNIYVQSCTIRDCDGGPFYITESVGKYEFRNCLLKDSYGGGYYEPEKDAELIFVECSFGTKETNRWYFDEDATFTDCYWEEITEYPDVEPEWE